MNQQSNLQQHDGGGNDESTRRDSQQASGTQVLSPREALDRTIITLDGITKNDRKHIPQHVYEILVQTKEMCVTAFHGTGVSATAGKGG